VTLSAGQAASFSVTFTPTGWKCDGQRIGSEHRGEFTALDLTQRCGSPTPDLSIAG
jgi:hypothetical protein